MSPAAAPARLRALLEPVVRGVGLDLEDVAVTPAGRRRLVRVVVDGDTGVSLDAVAQVSTAVSAALDGSDALGDSPYVLEVTSPGVDRPLREPRHWRRAVGRLVSVTPVGRSAVTGRVVSASGESVTLEVDGEPTTLALADLGPGHVQVEFSRSGAAADQGDGAPADGDGLPADPEDDVQDDEGDPGDDEQDDEDDTDDDGFDDQDDADGDEPDGDEPDDEEAAAR